MANVTRRLGFTQANVKWDSEEQQEWKALPGWSGSRAPATWDWGVVWSRRSEDYGVQADLEDTEDQGAHG